MRVKDLLVKLQSMDQELEVIGLPVYSSEDYVTLSCITPMFYRGRMVSWVDFGYDDIFTDHEVKLMVEDSL